jgi:hypothetical protein
VLTSNLYSLKINSLISLTVKILLLSIVLIIKFTKEGEDLKKDLMTDLF